MATVTKWGSERWLSDMLKIDVASPDLVALADGRYAVSFSSGDATLSVGVFSQIFNGDGSKTGSPEGLNSTTSGTQTWSAVAAFSDGKFVVVWPGDIALASVWYAKVGTDGQRVGDDVPLTEDFTDQGESDVAILTDGSFVVTYIDGTWNDENSYIPAVQRFAANGDPIGSPFYVGYDGDGGVGNANDTLAPTITALTNGNYVVTWTQKKEGGTTVFDIHGQVCKADGTTVGSEFTANTAKVGNQDNSSITALADGAFVVAWDSSDGTVRFQRYDSGGVAQGSEIIISDSGSAPSLVTLKDGRFAAFWGDDNGDLPFDVIMGAVYKADGTLSVSEFKVNTVSDGFAELPSATVLADGRIAVGYYVEQSEHGHDGSYVQIIDPRTEAIDIDGSNTLGDQLYGTKYGDKIEGRGGDDKLFGEKGTDKLLGGAGKDTLTGGDQNDSLTGGAAVDRLTGGKNDDRFIFTVKTDSGVGSGKRDIITDFNVASTVEKIDIGALSTKTFVWKGTGAFSTKSDVEVRYKFEGTTKTIVEIDLNSDNKAEMQIELTGHLTLTKADFFL